MSRFVHEQRDGTSFIIAELGDYLEIHLDRKSMMLSKREAKKLARQLNAMADGLDDE